MANNTIFGEWSLSDNGNMKLRTSDVTYLFRGCKSRAEAEKLLKNPNAAKEEWLAPNGRQMITIKETSFGTVSLDAIDNIMTVEEMRDAAEQKMMALLGA